MPHTNFDWLILLEDDMELDIRQRHVHLDMNILVGSS